MLAYGVIGSVSAWGVLGGVPGVAFLFPLAAPHLNVVKDVVPNAIKVSTISDGSSSDSVLSALSVDEFVYQGRVFALVWHGSRPPFSVLGSYEQEVRNVISSGAQPQNVPRGGLRPPYPFHSQNTVGHFEGHMRSYWLWVRIPALTPPGFTWGGP